MPRLLVVALVLGILFFPAPTLATDVLDRGNGWVQVVWWDVADEYNVRETFSVNRPTYKIHGGGFDGRQVGDTIMFYVRVEDYFAFDCGWWYVYGGGDTVTVNVTDPKGVTWSVGAMTTPTGMGVLGTANISNMSAEDFGGHFGIYYANFNGNNTAWKLVNFTILGEPRVKVSLPSSVLESTNFCIAANITDYNGTGIAGITVKAHNIRTGQRWTLNDDGSGNYSICTAQIASGGGDHVINIFAENNTAKYTLDGTANGVVSVNATFRGTEPIGLGLPFFAQLAASLSGLLSSFSFYLLLASGIVILSRERVLNLLLVLAKGGRRVG